MGCHGAKRGRGARTSTQQGQREHRQRWWGGLGAAVDTARTGEEDVGRTGPGWAQRDGDRQGTGRQGLPWGRQGANTGSSEEVMGQPWGNQGSHGAGRSSCGSARDRCETGRAGRGWQGTPQGGQEKPWGNQGQARDSQAQLWGRWGSQWDRQGQPPGRREQSRVRQGPLCGRRGLPWGSHRPPRDSLDSQRSPRGSRGAAMGPVPAGAHLHRRGSCRQGCPG